MSSPTAESAPSWALPALLGLAVAVLGVAPYVAGYAITSVLASLLLVPPLVLYRHYPVLALRLGVAGAVAQLIAVGQPVLTVVVVPFLVYTTARWAGEHAQFALVAGWVGSVLGPLRWTALGDLGGSGTIFLGLAVVCASLVGAAYLVGTRRRETLTTSARERESERERARLQQAEEEQRAQAQAAWERNRIARELHDIVAHSLSVIVVQAEGGRAVAARAPEQASEVLGTIADTGRNALVEMRRIVGLLRAEDGGATEYGPAPSLDDLPDLVRQTAPTAALTVYGTPPAASPAVGLTAYRTVQEALTNVLKHAGPHATARVTVAYTADSVEIEVTDDGRGAAVEPDGQGLGLRGMTERVELLGGWVTAGPQAGGGFVVRASLPLAGAGAGS